MTRIISAKIHLAALALAIAVAVSAFWSGDGVTSQSRAALAQSRPVFTFSWDSPDDPVVVGESFNIEARIRNVRGTTGRGGISFSFPSLTGGVGYSTFYESSAAAISAVRSNGMDVSFLAEGKFVNDSDERRIRADHLLIESDGGGWSSSSDRTLRLRVTPKRAGRFDFRVRGWLCADGYQNCGRYPYPGARYENGRDQQGWSAVFRSVTVEAADDHSDRRSSATRVSVGSSASGVIETSSDKDFFSFRARGRTQYAIETSYASGSAIDTIITLYDSNGSRLVVDNNSGVGRASKIVSSMLSSGTYYVEVKGGRGWTGGYRLSVSEFARMTAPAPTISRISIPNEATLRRSFDINIELRNDGGNGERGGLSVSFPTLTGGSKTSDSYTSSRAGVLVAGYTSGTRNVSLYKTGDSLNRSNGRTMSALHLLVESDDAAWRSNASRVLTLRVTPKTAGDLPVRVRGWICADRYSDCARAPTYGTDDQQGYNTAARTVNVVAPPTPEPEQQPAETGARNGLIAFDSDRDGNPEIYTMNADGSGLTRLTNNSNRDQSPSWSPDGRRIAFESTRNGNYEIYVMNADGSGVARLTNNSAGDYNPSWSPDGRRIAFTSHRNGNYEIYVMNADGSGVARLTNNSASDNNPSWSPDGRRIAFDSERTGNAEIYAMNADGSGVARLTNNSAGDYNPSWSPDGRRIAFDSGRDGGNTEIYVMNADGSGVARLTNNSAPDWGPSWAPDGRRIAFNSERDGNIEIYAMNADGSGVTRLTNNSADDWFPSWGPSSASGGGAPPADDHAASRSSATRVSVGSSVSGVIETPGDMDTFSFRATRNVEYTIQTTIASGSAVDTLIGLHNDSRRLASDNDSGSGRASKIVWTAPSSGTYYVAVEGRNRSTGGYRLSVSKRAQPPADDHARSLSSATRLSVGSSVSGVIETPGDLDLFSFRAARNVEYTIQTTIVSGSAVDTLIGLWDSSVNRLARDDDSGSGRASKIVWTAPSSGTYYVGVEGENRSTGGYRLSVSERAQPPADDHASSRSAATRLSVGSSVSGVIEKSGDLDAFSFRATRNVEYTIQTTIASGSAVDTMIGIHNDSRRLASDNDSGSGRASKIVWTAPSSGTYYIGVHGVNGSTGGYRLSVSERAQPPADDHAGGLSSATRVSVGSSVSGVIETSGDVDVFSFGAARNLEYTIQTSIVSGSALDTWIGLYNSSVNELASDDNSGSGRASKIVWTAPSSGTYYVAVFAENRTTGGYSLSVSERARTPAPVPTISRISIPNAATAGRGFDINIELRNDGGNGERGGVSVSFPTLTGGSKSSNGWSSSRADVIVVGYTSGARNVSLYKTGDSLNHSNGRSMSARHLLIESDDATWNSGTRRVLTLRVTPKTAGDLPVMVRGWICADRYSNCARAPTRGTNDQQGYRAAARTVNVAAPPEPEPATRGGRIAFTSQRDGNAEIYAMNADGSGLTRLTNNSAGDSHPDWSPDGRKIAFASTRDGGENDIYVMNADGSGVERITTDNSSGSPSWSPDGRRIAFTSRRDGPWEVYVMNADGSNVARVTNNSISEGKPSWSRDGRRLTFDAYPQGQVYTVNVDGSNFQSIAWGWNPAFSPTNNSLIAFGSGGIRTMNADGSNITRLTSHGGGAAWSPDGRRISFTSRGGAARDDIYAVDADGSNVTRLTTHSANDHYSSWGP